MTNLYLNIQKGTKKTLGKLLRAITDDGLVKAFVFDSTDVVTHAKKIHSLSNVATAALGRTLTAAVMMGSDMKDKNDRVSIQIRSMGEIGNVVAESYKTGEVKGFVSNPEVSLPLREDGHLDVGGALGHGGTLSVVKDVGLSEPQVGTVEIVSGEIGDDISYYYMQSEQIPTVVGVGVLVSKDGIVLGSGGYMVQLMPNHTEAEIEMLEKNIAKLPKSVSMFFAEDKDPHALIEALFENMPYKILEETTGEYKCDCSYSRVSKALVSLGRVELEKMTEKGEDINMSCHYCKKNYCFTSEDINSILKSV